MTIKLTVNGTSREMPATATISQLLESLEIPPLRVAVEHNRTILKKVQFSDTVLHDGDVVEIVHFVGGG